MTEDLFKQDSKQSIHDDRYDYGNQQSEVFCKGAKVLDCRLLNRSGNY